MAVETNDKLVKVSQLSSSLNALATKADSRFLKNSDKGDLATKNKVALADLDTDASAKSDALDTLIGSDANKSARTIANEELAARLIPASAKEALDTLEEIAAWIQSHPDDVAAINAKLTLGTHEVGGEQVQYANVKAYVEAYVAAQIGDAGLSQGDGISISNKIVSLVLETANANGLSVGANGLALALATASAAGAMSAGDKTKLDGFEVATDTEIQNIIDGIWAAA